MAFHWLVNILRILTTLKFYTILHILSLSAKEGETVIPLDLLAELLRLAFTGARVHCWSMHSFCLPGLLFLLFKATFLPVKTKPVLLCGVTLSLMQQCRDFLLSSVRFLLAHFTRLPPEWHFNVTHEVAEVQSIPLSRLLMMILNSIGATIAPMRNVHVTGHLSKFEHLTPILWAWWSRHFSPPIYSLTIQMIILQFGHIYVS